MTWLDDIATLDSVTKLSNMLAAGESCSAQGAVGSSTLLLTAVLRGQIKQPLLLVVAHLDDADEAMEELEGLGIDAAQLPAMEDLPGETHASIELLAERLMLVRRLIEGDVPPIIVAPIHSLMQAVPDRSTLSNTLRVLHKGDTMDPAELAGWLSDAGYERVETIEEAGEFAIRGGIIDVFVPGATPVRIDLFGDEVEALYEVDLDTMGSDRRIDRACLVSATIPDLELDCDSVSFLQYLPAESVAVLAELIEILEQARGYYERVSDGRSIIPPPEVLKMIAERLHAQVDVNQFSTGAHADRCVQFGLEPLPAFSDDASKSVAELAVMAESHDLTVLCQNDGEAQRMGELLSEFAPGTQMTIETRYLHRGLIWLSDDSHRDRRSRALVPYHELMHRFHTRRRVRRVSGGRTMDAFVELEPGDFVVHRDHGIARFTGLKTIRAKDGQSAQEYLTLQFAKSAVLHVPAAKIELVQKYVGGFHGRPDLSILGGKRWKAQKERVRDAVEDLAGELLRVQAAREAQAGIQYPADTPWQHEFDAEFPYEETEDQLAAIGAIKRDMSAPRPMDRLVCGDVGFGKTEVAIRAAFKAVESGRQVAVLVPTTVLAEQHERTLRQRFAGYPFFVESISRFKTGKEQKEILAQVARGRIDIIIGTHRLLSKDVQFADLGLVIIDEEQRFGVEHKQRLLGFRLTADVLTLSATPIPRTLHMAMLGLRDISSLSTPPADRRAIVTDVIGYNKTRVKQAIARELAREGQVYFVHNRVHNIISMADEVQALAPDARVIIGHGQMPSRKLEAVMLEFIRGKADILVCTTIIESGIDIPTVNTMFINDAQRFGLSELHQLRGRVGRYKHRAYCYLIVPHDQVLSEVAVKRLKAIENYSMLGAGFKIAMRDLEIRGAGNLLGPEQSGHIAAVGYDMYCRLLEGAVRELKNDVGRSSIDTTIDIGISGSLAKGYIPSDLRRMEAYRRVSQAESIKDIEQVQHDLSSAYGELPTAGQTLIDLAELRLLAAALEIRSMTRADNDIVFKTTRPDLLQLQMQGIQGTLRLVGQPDAHNVAEVYYRPPKRFLEPQTLLAVLRKRLQPVREESGVPAQ